MLVKTARKYQDIVQVIYDVTAGLVSQHCLHKTSQRITKPIRNSFVLVRLRLKFKGCIFPGFHIKRNLQEGIVKSSVVMYRVPWKSGTCRKALLKSSLVMYRVPWNLCNISCIGATFVQSGNVTWFILRASTQIRGLLPSLCITVRGFKYAECDSYSISSFINCRISSLTAGRSATGKGREQIDF